MAGYFLIDYENVRENGFHGMEFLTEQDTLIIFYSQHEHMVSIDMISALQERNIEVRYIPAGSDKKEALYFVLSTYLGYLNALPDTEYCFIISSVSDDEYESVLRHWMRQQKKVYLARDIAEAFSRLHPDTPVEALQELPSADSLIPPDAGNTIKVNFIPYTLTHAEELYTALKDELAMSEDEWILLWKILKQAKCIASIPARENAVCKSICNIFGTDRSESIFQAVQPFIQLF